MWSRSRSISRELAQDAWVLTNAGRMRRHWFRLGWTALALIVAAAALILWERYYLRDRQMEALARESQQLRVELSVRQEALEQAMLDLEIAAVTRAELERQLSAMTEQYRQVREELEFIKSAGAGPDESE